MCNRHSFILTKSGKVFWGLGLTDSHTSIRELAGLSVNDDTVNAYEWHPPVGWPDADWNIGLVKDNHVFETKSSHEKAMERHIKKLYPTMDAWNTPDNLYQITREDILKYGWTELFDGEIISPKKGDRFLALSGTITVTGQTGGYCFGDGNSTINSTGQTGGYCFGDGNSTINSTGQTGGYCWGYGNSTINSTGQTGGYCWGYGNSTINSTGQTGGDCFGDGNSTINSTGQTGGYCFGDGNSTINRTGQTGGDCRGYDNSTINKH